MENEIIFDWPGLDYNPRNEYLYRWSPQFYYWNPISDFAPGFGLKKVMVHMNI